MDDSMSLRVSQGTKYQDRLKLEKSNVSCGNLHSEIMENVGNIPPASSGNNPKKEEELVKYMSSVPSYLEKGENLKEKALNFGVLDFRRLEKWQSNNKTMSQQRSRVSPSTSNSSFFSTDESSTRSSRAHSSSPARQRIHQPSLQSQNASPTEGYYSQGVKDDVEKFRKFEDLKAESSNPLRGKQSVFTMYQSFSKNQSGIKLHKIEKGMDERKKSKRKDTEPKMIPQVEKNSLDSKNYVVASRSKGKEKIQDSESTSRVEECQGSFCVVNRSSHQRCKTMVFPRIDAESSHAAERRRRSFSEGSFHMELFNADYYSDIPHSCPLPRENDLINEIKIKQSNSIESKNIKVSYIPLQPAPCSAKISISPSSGKKMEEKSTSMPRNSTDIKSSMGSDLIKGTVEAPKSRIPSPTRRLINGLGWIGRMSSSKESSEIVIAKSGSGKHVTSSFLEDSGNDKSKDKGRSQSSPLRRLLDPLLKPKASTNKFAEPPDTDPSSVDRACKSSTIHPVKVKLDFLSCKTVVVDDSHGSKKQRSTTVQALLKIIIKNGLPLFTFAVDNSSDILATTLRKDEKCWTYTFLTIHELKKKNVWINRGSKDKNRSYVPNAVAQMTVSNYVDQVRIREFVLSSVDQKQADQDTSNPSTSDELAAIIVKVPKETPDVESGYFVRIQKLLCATVILPGGVHGLPGKGDPSPLIRRWKSGGLCDCGGWDLGCRLRVLANQTKLGSRSSSAKSYIAADRFELFSQGEVPDNTPMFSLSPFKDGIFSVDFNSSISYLQAFSICIAVLNSRKPYDLSDLCKLFEEKSSEDTIFVVNEGIKAPRPGPTG